MGVQVIPIPTEVVSHSLTFPFPFLCFIPIPMGFPWDSRSHWESHSMHISSLYAGPSGAAKLCTNIRRLYVKHDQSSTNKMYQKLIIFVALISSTTARLSYWRPVKTRTVCLSVCLSVTSRYWVGKNAHKITWFSPPYFLQGSPGTLSFLRPTFIS